MSNSKEKEWAVRYTLLIIVLLLLAIPSAIVLDQYVFNPVTTESIISLLVPIFVIAVFLERALEVFVSTWRSMNRTLLEQKLTKLEDQKDAQAKVVKAKKKLKIFKAKTKRLSFLIGLGGGIIISMVGVRVLRPLTSMDADPTGIQSHLFNYVDIILTGALIGGGSDGIHKLMNVFTGFLDMTRDKIEASKPKPENSQ